MRFPRGVHSPNPDCLLSTSLRREKNGKRYRDVPYKANRAICGIYPKGNDVLAPRRLGSRLRGNDAGEDLPNLRRRGFSGGSGFRLDQLRTRSRYSPSLVSMRIFSPALMNGGT